MNCSLNFSVDLSYYFQMVSITIWRAAIGRFYNCSNRHFMFRSISFFHIGNVFDVLKFLILSSVYYFDSLIFNFSISFTIINLVFKVLKSIGKLCAITHKLSYDPNAFVDVLFFYQVYILWDWILLSGDVATNPGPRPISNKTLSICHWNAHSISSHNFTKIDLLSAFEKIHHFDIICISETFLDSTFSSDLKELTIDNFTTVRADHPSDKKRGGVCVFFRTCLPIRILNISILSECIILELLHQQKSFIFSTLYRSPSQTSDEFHQFLDNFENNLQLICDINPFSITILGDFNARSANWWIEDRTSPEGLQIDSLTSYYGLHQLISEPTHILNNSSTCIDLIFTSQPNLVTNSGVFPSLHPNCHHQITFATFNLEVHYPPPYKRLVWNYEKANSEMIQRAISNFDWETTFANCNINDSIRILNETILNIFSNFCPSKTIICNDKEPPWINDEIKNLIEEKNIAYKRYLNSQRNNSVYQQLFTISNQLNETLKISKENYYKRLSSQLANPITCKKKYWSILKSHLIGKKIPLIPPIFLSNEFISDFQEKAKAFNKYFSEQCTPIVNSSEIPTRVILETNEVLDNFFFSVTDISNIINNLDPNKSHGYDNISVRLIKICGLSICKPLNIIFSNCLSQGIFPEYWKKANVVPVHKKNEKYLLSNYRPISLLPIFSKIFERLIFNSIYNYLISNNLLSPHQSGFKPGDSCTYQLLSITHIINNSLDHNESHEVRGVFLDMSKAFDRVWHAGLIHKLKTLGISGNLLMLLKSFLSDRKQRVVINGQNSDWMNINAGVPQGSILGPLLFLVYVNDLSRNLKSTVKLFADDVSLFSVVKDPIVSANELNHDLSKISEWAYNWKMTFNPDPLKQAIEVLFSRKRKVIDHPDLIFNGNKLTRSSSQKHLGMILDEKLNFNEHISIKLSQARKLVGSLRKLYYLIPRKSLMTIYKSFIRPHLDYCDLIYDKPSNESFCNKIESIQYSAMLAITGCIKGTSKDRLYSEVGLESLKQRRWYRRLTAFYQIITTKSPFYLFSIIPKPTVHMQTRSSVNIPPLNSRTEQFKNSFFPNVVKEWNALNIHIRNSTSLSTFKKNLIKLIRPAPNRIYNVHDPVGLKFLTRLRLSFSHLREHKFKYNFQDTLNPLCSCSLTVESTEHFFLCCLNFNQQRQILLNSLNNLGINIATYHNKDLVNLLLYGNSNFDDLKNHRVLLATISFLTSSNRFDLNLL